MTDLTKRQREALADLRKRGHLFFTGRGRGAASGTLHPPYSGATLQALVDAGLARWQEGGWPTIVPVEEEPVKLQPRQIDVAVLTVTVTLPEGTRATPEILEALDNLANVMHVQAEDGLYTDGGGRHGDGEHLLDFDRTTCEVSVI